MHSQRPAERLKTGGGMSRRHRKQTPQEAAQRERERRLNAEAQARVRDRHTLERDLVKTEPRIGPMTKALMLSPHRMAPADTRDDAKLAQVCTQILDNYFARVLQELGDEN